MSELRPIVTATRRLPARVEAELRARYDARLNPEDRPLDPRALRHALETSDAVVCTVTDRLDAATLGAPPVRARLLANFGVGVDHVDLAAARALGLAVTNTPDVLTDCTADLTMALVLMTLRRLGEGEREVRAGRWTGWRPTHLLGRQVTGKTLGVVGLGRIGLAVARRAHHGFGMPVLGVDPTPPAAGALRDAGVTLSGSLDALLGASDVVSLHCPATPATYHLINRERLARMRPGTVLINTSRGSVVDERALAEALRTGQIGGAGLDVYEGEPAVRGELTALEQVVLLPHLGSATEETRTAMGRKVLDNLAAHFVGRALPDRVR
jgi:lactate dehydrogenase-like 2-hydroxyacid dehydrogenase